MDHLQSAVISPEGGYLIGGYSQSAISGDRTSPSSGQSDYWIVKTDEQGDVEWDKAYGGNSFDLLLTIASVPGGGYILGGLSRSGISGDKSESSRGDYDFWVVKTDGQGNKIWDKTIGGSASDHLHEIHPLADGSFILGGYSHSGISGDKTTPSKGNGDFWLVKINAAGEILWDQTYGGSNSDVFQSLVPTPDGGFLLGGRSFSNISGDKTEASRGMFDYWIVKTDAEGNKEWDKTYGGSGNDVLRSIVSVPGGGYILGGTSASEISGEKTGAPKGYNYEKNAEGDTVAYPQNDYWVVKTDEQGNKIWDKTIGGSATDNLSAITPALNEGYLLSGVSLSPKSGDKSEGSRGIDIWVVKISETGSLLWDETYGGDQTDEVTEVVSPRPGEYLLAGTSWSDASGDKSENASGINDYWILKVKEEGVITPQEPKPAPTAGHVNGGGSIELPAGTITAMPDYQGKATFAFSARQQEEEDKPQGKAVLSIPRKNFLFIGTASDWIHVGEDMAFLHGTGRLNREEGYSYLISVTDKGLGNRNEQDHFRMIIWDPEGNVVFDNQRGSNTYARATKPIERGGIIIHRLMHTDITNSGKIVVWPVPLEGNGLWLEIPDTARAGESLQFTIRNMQGHVMAKATFEGAGKKHWSLDHTHWPKGVYVLTIKDGSSMQQERLIK